MTDKEIIKAFEHCRIKKDCKKCPLERTTNCMPILFEEVFSLINRQQAEIERLEDTLKIYHKYNPAIRHAKSEAIKEFAERLNAQFSNMENQPPSDRMIIRINEVKSLMDWILHDITKQAIAEVVKEMTEEADDV
jgi:predicted DNA-binding protein YlxM (UPF0122 family)